MVRALTIGGATLDTIIEYEDMETMEIQKPSGVDAYLLLKEGAKVEVTKQKCFSGGGATNAAVSLKKYGHEVTFFGKIGHDSAGQTILSELQSLGISVDQVRFSKTYGTATSYVVPSLKGDRTIFAYRGANRDLLTEDLPVQSIEDADFIYVTSLSKKSAAQLPQIVKLAQTQQTKVAINPGSSQLELGSAFIKDALHGVDILILNYEEAQKLMRSLLLDAGQNPDEIGSQPVNLLASQPTYHYSLFSLKDFFRKILTMGPRIVVVTNGDRGVYIGTEKELYSHAALKVDNIVNTLGAGDAFGSNFCAAIYAGETIDRAVASGLINSASVIQFHDAKSGILSKAEITKRLEELSIELEVFQW